MPRLHALQSVTLLDALQRASTGDMRHSHNLHWVRKRHFRWSLVLRITHLSDVIVGSPHFANSDSHWRGESILHQPFHLIGHCRREEQRLPIRTDLPYDGPHLQRSNCLVSHSGLEGAETGARLRIPSSSCQKVGNASCTRARISPVAQSPCQTCGQPHQTPDR